MQISLSKDAISDSSKEIRVIVKISAVDDEQADLIYSHSFDLQHIEAGRSIAVQVFNKQPKTADLRKYGKLLFRALFSEDDASPARQLLDKILPPHPTGRILLELNGDNDLDVVPWEYAWGNHAYLVHQCMFARMYNMVPNRSNPGPRQKLMSYIRAPFLTQYRTESNRTRVDQTEFQHPKPPLRIVAVVPDPVIPPDNPDANLPALNLSDQFQNFINNHSANQKKVILDRVFPPTVDQMDVVLMNRPETATVLHFMGHCKSNNGARALIFEDKETGEPQCVDTTHLNMPTHLRLAFLSACNTRDVARVLLEHGAPNTVGSYCDLPDDLAREFESKFYQVLSGDSTVENAMWRARVFLHSYNNVRQRDYFPGAMMLYSSTIREDDGAFDCEIGDPIVNLHMPRNNLHILRTSPFFGRKKELVEVNSVLRRMANRSHQTSGVLTIGGISGEGKTALAIEAVRRTAHLFPGGIFAWQFDIIGISFIEYLRRLVEVVFPEEVQTRLKNRSDGGGDVVQSLEADIIKELEGYPACLLILDHADTLKLAETGDENGVALREWLQQIVKTSTVAVKILATSSEPLGWMGEVLIHLNGLDIDSGVDLFIRNLDTQVCQRMEKEEKAEQVLRDLIRLVDGHPLCLESLAHAVGLPHYRNVPLQELVGEHFSTTLMDGSLGSRNLETRFRPIIDMLPTQQRLLLFLCSLFTGPITEEVLEFVRHFVKCIDTSKKGIDSRETIATTLQQLYGRGLFSKQNDEYRIQFALREGARLCNSILKLRLDLPIPGLFNDTFVIGVVGPCPHVKFLALEWQLRRIQSNAHRELKPRGFGIRYYSIGNKGLEIFNIPGVNDHDSVKAAEEQYPSYRRLVVFIYNVSEGNRDGFPEFCTAQILLVVQDNPTPFILCLKYDDVEVPELHTRYSSVLMTKAAETLRKNLEETHWIAKTEASSYTLQATGEAYRNSASNKNINVNLGYKTVEKAYRKRNDNVRMEGPFIGRTKDLENLTKLLEGPKRYITVKGFGGMGKTSLALQAFIRYNSGSALALSLAGAPRSTPVILKIAEFFAINTKDLSEEDQRSQVYQNLEGGESILLYLDNMEDVKLAMESRESGTKDEARTLLNFFKGLPANVRILATSRVALGWPKEHLFDLAGLEPREGMLVFQQWSPQRSEAGDTDDQSGMELSRVTDGHPLSLRLLGGMFDNCKDHIHQFVKDARDRLTVAVNHESIDKRHESIDDCIKYSFDFLDDELQRFLGQLREWNVPFTSTLVMRALKDDSAAPSASLVATNLHQLWQRSWLNRRKYEQDPMLGDWRPNIIENETEFYSLHPRLHDFLNHRFDNVEATLPNDAEIQFYTALCYGVGFGVANDLAKQNEWCTKAANNGHLEAQLALAACYQGGCGVSQNNEKAFDRYLKAAEAGSKQAQSEISSSYWEDVGFLDSERATYWREKFQGDEENKTAPVFSKFDLSLPLIHRFAKAGDVAIVRTLSTNISDASVRDRTGRTPLHVAAQNGHIDVIEYLLYECNADISSIDVYGQAPLHLAARSGHAEVVWLFVADFGVDPNTSTNRNSNWTPLHYATDEGHLEIVKLLLADSKVDTNAKDKFGWTPFHWAEKHVEVVNVLLADSKVDANAKDNNGKTLLHWVSSDNRVEVVKVLLDDSRMDPTSEDKDGWTPLHWAEKHVEVVNVLLADSRVDVNAKDNNGKTLLHWVSSDNGVEVAKVLLADSRTDPTSKDKDGWTPLHWAEEHVEVVKLLLADSRTDANAKDNGGCTLLHWVSMAGQVDIVGLLLADSKVDPNVKDNDGSTPLHLASREGHVEVVKVLLADPKVDVTDSNGRTPLHYAAQNGHVEIVKVLLADTRTDPNSEDKDGWSPLHLASQNGHVEVVRLLVADFGADTNVKNNESMTLSVDTINGNFEQVTLLLADFMADSKAKIMNEWTPLHGAALYGHVEVLKLLVADFRANANAKEVDGWTPLYIAAAKGHVEVVRILVGDLGTDANCKTNNGSTPLHIAVQNGHVEVVRLLVAEFGADPSAKANGGETPLHEAARRGYVEVVRILGTEFGVDINDKDNNGWTSLHFAAQNGNEEVVRLLVAELGADVNIRNNEGATALHVSAQNEQVNVVKLLEVEFGGAY